MTILFISYWGINEGLTQSTILPHLRLLAADERVSKIILTTIERDEPAVNKELHIAKTTHVSIPSISLGLKLITKSFLEK